MFCIGTLKEATKKLIKETHQLTSHGHNQPEPPKQLPNDDYIKHNQPRPDEFRGKTKIKLKKLPGDNDFGIVTTSGSGRQNNLLKVAYIKPGTPAYRHDGIEVGDYISSLEGKTVLNLGPQDLSSTLHNKHQQHISLELDYTLPDTRHTTFSAVKKKIEVKLTRDEHGSLGMTLRGGNSTEANHWRPLIVTQIRPGGPADREGTIKVGDRILSINHVSMYQKSLDHALKYLKNPNTDDVFFLVEYDISVLEVVQNAAGPLLVEIDKLPGCSLGVTLAEGYFKGHRVMYITEVEQASIADRCGALHHGDHILAIDGYGLEEATIEEANDMLRVNPGHQIQLEIVPAKLVVQYTTYNKQQQLDTTKLPQQQSQQQQQHQQLQQNTTPQLSQQHRPLHRSLTLPQVTTAVATNQQQPQPKQLHTLQRQQRLLRLPLPRKDASLESDESAAMESSDNSKSTNHDDGRFSSASLSSLISHNTYNSMTTQVGSAMLPPCHQVLNWDTLRNRCSFSSSQGVSSCSGTLGGMIRPTPHTQICHVDVVEVVLVAERRSFGLQIEPVNGRVHTGSGSEGNLLAEPPIISYIEPRGPAERCGVLQEGDRVLAINGENLEGRTMREVDEMVKESGVKIILYVEFDVAESIIPSSGVFVVKLAKRSAGLGVTISCPKNRKPGQHLVISDVKKGSVAHRTGSIQPGDKLLAIDNVRLDDLQCSLEDSARILQDTHDIVKLTIQKDENFADEPDPTHLITYTVELPKFAGPVGITVSGSEEPFDPIFISSLLPGGMAERTGALHVGDRLLAINGTSLRGRTLTDAVHLLQNAGPTVNLKITRPANKRVHEEKMDKGGPGSMDSALESWASSGGTEGYSTVGAKVFYHPSLRHRPRSQHYFDSVDEQADDASDDPHATPPAKNTPPQTLRHQNSMELPIASTVVTTSSSDAGIDNSGGSITSNAFLPPSSAAENVMRWQDREFCKPSSASPSGSNKNNTSNNNNISNDNNNDNSPICSDSFGSRSNEADEWSKRLDELDQLRLNMSPAMDSFSDLPDIAEVIADVENSQWNQQGKNRSERRGSARLSVGQTGPESVSHSSQVHTQTNVQNKKSVDQTHLNNPDSEIQLQEVEEQLQNIFTPTPIELLRVTIAKAKDKDDFGFGLSDGVFEKGVYVSAVRQGGPAFSKLRPFDRILQVNSTKTKDMECSQLVPLIASSGQTIELVITRNPLLSLQKGHCHPKTFEQFEKGGSLRSFTDRRGRHRSLGTNYYSSHSSPRAGTIEAPADHMFLQKTQSSCDHIQSCSISTLAGGSHSRPSLMTPASSSSAQPKNFRSHHHLSNVFPSLTRETFIGNDSLPTHDESDDYEEPFPSSKNGTVRRKPAVNAANKNVEAAAVNKSDTGKT